MNSRAISTVFALAAAFVGSSVFAQSSGTVASLVDIRGNVLVSQGDAMVAAVPDLRVMVGARIVTTAGSAVTVRYDKDCAVRLEENRRFTVKEFTECRALIASVEPLTPTAGAAGAGAAAGTGSTAAAGTGAGGLGGAGAVAGGVGLSTVAVVAGGAIVAGVGYAVYDNNRSDNESTNVTPN